MFAVKWLLTLIIVVVLGTSACVRREGRNSDCKWPGEAGATVLDPRQPRTSRHLSADTEFAEELADRYTNVHYGPHSGYSGPAVAGIERHQCMDWMFDEVAKTHGVTKDVVIASYGRNRLGIDLSEILSFAIIYGIAAVLTSRWLVQRYPPSESWAGTLLMLTLCSLAFGAGAALIGPLWSMTAENVRIGTGHLGPRVLRLPMERHQGLAFLSATVLFWILALVFRPSPAYEAEAAEA